MKIQLNTKIFKQNPNMAYCAVNSIKTVIHYYKGYSPSKQTIKKYAKSHPKNGSLIKNTLSTLKRYGIKTKVKRIESLKIIQKTLKAGNLIVVGYQTGKTEYHLSVINGVESRNGTIYIKLADSWLGQYEFPYFVFNVLANGDLGKIYICENTND